MAKLQMKSGFTRKLKLPLILTLAHSVIKQLGLVEYINENIPWAPSHWEITIPIQIIIIRKNLYIHQTRGKPERKNNFTLVQC